MGMTLNVIHASNERDIDAFFATLVQRRASAFLNVADPLFSSRLQQVVVLAAFHKIPAIYHARGFTDAGGLMSYSPKAANEGRQVGTITAASSRREAADCRPAADPVRVCGQPRHRQDASRFHLMLAIADEVIE
jgi:hypothetical protein